MESAVSTAFSKDHVTRIEKTISAHLMRWTGLPACMSFPTAACALETRLACAEKRGTKRSVIERTRLKAGTILPNR